MKPYTRFLAFIHLMYILGVMWFGPYILFFHLKNKPCTLLTWMIIWLVTIFIQLAHWYIPESKNECFLSYLEKKSENPDYVKGSDPEKTYSWELLQDIWPCTIKIKTLRQIHMVVAKLAFLSAIFFITAYNKCVPNHHTVKQSMFVILSMLTMKYMCFDSAICTEKNKL